MPIITPLRVATTTGSVHSTLMKTSTTSIESRAGLRQVNGSANCQYSNDVCASNKAA